MRVSRRNKKAQHKYEAELRKEIPNWNLQVRGDDDDNDDDNELLDDDNDSEA
jgi:hypothetical protein